MFKATSKLRNSTAIAYAVFALSSCDKNETNPAQPYDDGVIVINSGNFFDNNGSLSLIQRDSKTASFDIFLKENNRSFAGGLTDYAEVDEKGIILVDNSTDGKDAVEIVDAHNFKSIASIKGEIDNPQKAVKAGSNKVYITCWDTFNPDYSYKTGFIAVLDLTANKITKKIPVDKGASSIIVIGTNAYVGNVGGQKTIKVIDTQKDEVTATIEVGANPSNFVLDGSNKIWMTAGKEIVLFNPITKNIETKLKGGTNDKKTPSSLSISKDYKTLFYTNNFYDTADGYKLKGEINSLNIADGTSKVFINRTFESVGFDNESNQIYTTLIPSYKQAGYIFRYQASGALIDSIKTEIGPIGFLFK
ncbi:YncE family protein [Emticicia sp. SJ17W-69]|uniref:YncE family protein n=1 Tax=Emticicia sp. SJ17W-69 TaxID=3421657 RepID=UPI003EB99EDD